MSRKKTPPNDEREGWAEKLVELFGRPLSKPFSEFAGLLDDYIRVTRFRRRAKLLKELEEEGLVSPAETDRRQLIFRKNSPPDGDDEE